MIGAATISGNKGWWHLQSFFARCGHVPKLQAASGQYDRLYDDESSSLAEDHCGDGGANSRKDCLQGVTPPRG
jgi:hypothetical protein